MKKISIVKQRDYKDCGPACIQSILKYYGGFVSLEKIRIDCYTNINGTSAYHMVNALRKYGFDSYGAKIDKEINNADDLVLPLIAHLNLKNGLSHYVVVYEITSKYALLMDPAKGIVKMKLNEFNDIFTNVVIICYLKSTYIANYKNNSLLKFILELFKNEKSFILKILLFGLFSVLFTITSGFYFKFCFNYNLEKSTLKIIMIVFLFIYFSKLLFDYLASYIKNYLIRNIDYNINQEFFDKVFNLPSNIVKNRDIGEIVTRVSELNNLHELVSDIVVTIFINTILTIISFIVLYFINSLLTKVLVLFLAIFVIVCILTNKIIYNMIKQNIESNEKFNGVVIENCSAFDSIKNNSIEKYAKKNINYSLVEYLKTNFIITKNMNIINLIKNSLIDLMYYSIITLGIILHIKNKITLVDFITFESILVYLVEPLKNIMNLFPKLNYLKASLDKILDFMSLESESSSKLSKFKNGDIIISKLNYSYNDYNNVLENINLKIEKNSKVMINGKSGIGKSTFCKLLNRTYTYNTGDIFIGNINLKDYNLKTIRNNILYLSQNEFLFNDTIKNNIILDNKYDEFKFNKITNICCLEEVVSKKALRFETFIDKDFSNLSGGEKQRIILARALYRNFEILILDEALSEVNIDLERIIIKNIEKNFNNKTIIYVTHKNHEKLFEKCLTIGENNEIS